MPLPFRIAAIDLDCGDHDALAAFYCALLGGTVAWRNDHSVGVAVDGLTLVMQRVEQYTPPPWPGSSIVHLDLATDASLASSVDNALALGAERAPLQPDSRWTVLLDPAGHPFCITTVTPDLAPRAS